MGEFLKYDHNFWVCEENVNSVAIQMQAAHAEQHFPVVLFVYAVQGGSNFWVWMKC